MSKSLIDYLNVPIVFGFTAICISIAIWLYFENQIPRVDTAPEVLPFIEQELNVKERNYQLDNNPQARAFQAQSISLEYSPQENRIYIDVETIQLLDAYASTDSIPFFPSDNLMVQASTLIEKQVGKVIERRIRPGIELKVSIATVKE